MIAEFKMNRLLVVALSLSLLAFVQISFLPVSAFIPLVKTRDFPPHAHTFLNNKNSNCIRSPTKFQGEEPSNKNTRLHLSEQLADTTATSKTAFTEQIEELVTNDPLVQEVSAIKNHADLNAIINTAIVLIIGIIVLANVATVDSNIMRGWTASEMAYRIPLDNWESYTQVLNREPVLTKAVTSATVYTIGDFISQRAAEGRSMGEIDRWRVFRSLLAGLIGHGPLSHLWYDASEGLFNDVLHWTEWWSFFPKVVLDQTTWGPFWNNCYILLLGIFQRNSLESIWADMKRTTVPLVVSGLKLWPLAHCITYGLVPVENRLLWVDFVEILWVTILATQAAGLVEEAAQTSDDNDSNNTNANTDKLGESSNNGEFTSYHVAASATEVNGMGEE